MNFNHKEAMRYLRANPKDEAASILIDTVYLKLRNEVQARHTVKHYKCIVDAEGVTLDCGVRFSSKNLAKHLADCDEVLLFGATLGVRVDAAIRRLAMLSVAEGAAAQAVGAALIESYCDEVQAKLDTGRLKQKTRFSPGYGDWNLTEQKLLFSLLDCAKTIGLTLTEGGMMVPTKSVTAIIGLTEAETCVSRQHKCSECANLKCEFRSVE